MGNDATSAIGGRDLRKHVVDAADFE